MNVGMGKDETMFQRRLAQIAQLPDGPEKEAALNQLSLDYPGRLEDMQQQAKFQQEMAGQSMPRGRVAGPAANPYSVYIGANPLEIGAAATEKFMGHRGNRKAMDEMTSLRKTAELENRKLLDAGVQAEQARMLRGDPEEEKKREFMRLMMGY